MNGMVASCFTPERIITPVSTLPNHTKSVWFQEAAYRGLRNPAIINVRKPQVKKGENPQEVKENLDRRVKSLLNALNLRAYIWTPGERFTYFVATRESIDYTKLSGYEIESPKDPAKPGKRLKVNSPADGALFHNRESQWPFFEIPGRTFIVQAEDTGTAGDGSGYIGRSAATKLMQECGVPTKGVMAIQLLMLGSDYTIKGVYPIREDGEMPLNIDIVVDQESLSHQVHSKTYTRMKITRIRHKSNTRYFYLEPTYLGEIPNNFIPVEETVRVAIEIADQKDRDNWFKVTSRTRNYLDQLLQDATMDPKMAPKMTPADIIKSKTSLIARATELAQGNPFASPEIYRLMSGRLSQKWRSTHKHAERNETQFLWVDPEKAKGKTILYEDDYGRVLIRNKASTQMPGIMMSGEKMWLAYPPFWGYTCPEPGFARLIWHSQRADQLVAAGMSPEDMIKKRDALDTADCDDSVTLIFMEDHKALPWVLFLRTPSSIDGGVCLRISKEDERRVRELGYHFYQKVGDHRWPGLYDIGDDGQPIFPYALNPTPIEPPLTWTTDEEEATKNMFDLTAFSRWVGESVNRKAALDQARIYTPDKHKYCDSECVLDPALNGSSNPENIVAVLDQDLYEAVVKGIPQDPCIFWRSLAVMEDMHRRAREQDPSMPPIYMLLRTRCQEHHDPKKKVMSEAISMLESRDRYREACANGPTTWLMTKPRVKLANIVAKALQDRNQVWSAYAREGKKIGLSDLTPEQQEVLRDRNLELAIRLETEIVTAAYQKAAKTVSGYEHGQFTGLWYQLSAGGKNRFYWTDRRGDVKNKTVKPIITKATLNLPDEEQAGFLEYRDIQPTAIVRTKEQVQLDRDQEFRIQMIPGEAKNRPWELVDLEGKHICFLEKEARIYNGLNVQPVGYMPEVRTTGKRETWPMAKNILVLNICDWESIGLPQSE